MERPLISAHDSDIPSSLRRIDSLQSALRELALIENPQITDIGSAASAPRYEANAVWVYYPWLHTAVRIPDEATYYRLRTARNRNVITEAEQARYREACIGVAGLSVGSEALSSLVSTGGPKRLRIADPDSIEITNLNRINASLADLGANKSEVAARKVWELDPFADIDVFDAGISADTVDAFVDGLDVFIEEMDAIDMKIAAREACKKRRIPVVMATDNGNGAIVDIERFDLEPERPIFHGRIDLSGRKVSDLTRDEFRALASEIIDPALFTDRQRESVAQVGAMLAGIAQTATAATIAGAAAAYCARVIAIGGDMPSGRYVLGCDDAFRASRA